jgi:hypothetical protein
VSTTRLRSTWLASAGGVVLVLTFAGLAAGRVVLTEEAPPAPEVTTPDTTATFEDLNGNGIADACEEAGTVVGDPVAAEAALKAADLDADGVISVSEAARSGWTGGKNCNHGGYVSEVAQGSSETTEQTETTDAAAPTTECAPVAPPERDPALDEQKNGHGKWVSTVAQSEATGGKNCNHGGAVSEAAKKDHAAAAAAREAAKAERVAARAAAKAAKQHGHGKPN